MEVNNFDKLVKIVTENILQKVDLKKNINIKEKSCLVLIPSSGFGFTEYLSFIKAQHPDYDLYLGAHEEFSKTQLIQHDESIHFVELNVLNNEFIDLLDKIKKIIIVGPKVKLLKDLSQTNDQDDINHIILGGLMANKTVEVLINSNSLLFNKIAGTIRELRSMGLKVVNIQYQDNASVKEVELITEDYIVDLKEHGLNKIVLSKKQLITPLAKDKLRELKINVEYIEEAKQ